MNDRWVSASIIIGGHTRDSRFRTRRVNDGDDSDGDATKGGAPSYHVYDYFPSAAHHWSRSWKWTLPASSSSPCWLIASAMVTIAMTSICCLYCLVVSLMIAHHPPLPLHLPSILICCRYSCLLFLLHLYSTKVLFFRYIPT